MIEKEFSTLPLWQFKSLSAHSDLVHFVSGRAGGSSKGEKGRLNLSFMVGDDPKLVMENRKRLAGSLSIDPDKLLFPQQTHSLHVKSVSHDTSEKDLSDTDALITDCKGICISVMSADCVPVLLYDPLKKVVAAVHAGWRGTVGKIAGLTVKAMNGQYGCRPIDLVACIGPSIGPQIYEVGEEVISSVKNSFVSTDGLLIGDHGSGKALFNLWEANKRQLTELGIPDSSIEVAGMCTFQHSETFFSARRSKNQAGRFAAGIMMKQ
jgi:polyphenol oxidase